jgi:DNA helicase HerA-like ATPase
MLHPGRISVISDVGFSEEEQGFVGLYILLMLGRLKIDERLDDIGVVLMIDEATRRFPANSDYLRERVVKEINGMLHVGRKRSFMPVMMTQYPDDVPREIRDSCGVQVVFQVNIAGNASWLKQRLRPYRDLIDTLPIGEALVDSVAHNEPVHLCVPPSPVMEKPEAEKK